MRLLRFFIALALLAAVASPRAQASTITWGAPTDIVDASDVSTNGELVEAFNGAGNLVTDDLTINGVEFTTTGMLLPLSSVVGSDLFPGGSTGDLSYDLFLRNIDFGGGPNTSIQIGGGNLVVGEEYELQVWYLDTRRTFVPFGDLRLMTIGDGLGNSVDLNDQYVIGTFVASGTSQNLQLIANDFLNANLTGYQLRAISPIILGDVNGDGVVSFLDIAPFTAILSAEEYQEEADMDGDGTVGFLDIATFIGALFER